MQKHGNKYGVHRVIEPKGILPQPANKIDNNMDEIYDNEILIDVQTLRLLTFSTMQSSRLVRALPKLKLKKRLRKRCSST